MLLKGVKLLLSSTAEVNVRNLLLLEADSLAIGVFITKLRLTLIQPPPFYD